MPAPRLSSPYPATYQPPKAHGVPKIMQAMAQPPRALVGWGAAEPDDEPDEPLPGSREGQELQRQRQQGEGIVVPGGDMGSSFPLPPNQGDWPQAPGIDPRARWGFGVGPSFDPLVNLVGFGQTDSKVSKAEAHYREAPNQTHRCHECQFMSKTSASCSKVDGHIDPNMVCDYFHARPVGYGQSEGDFMPHDNGGFGVAGGGVPQPQQPIPPNLLQLLRGTISPFGSIPQNAQGPAQSLGQLGQDILHAPQVQNLGQHLSNLGSALSPSSGQSFPQRALNVTQEAGWEIPTTAYRAGLDAAAVAGTGGREQGFQPTSAPELLGQYGPDAAMMASGIQDAAKVPGMAKNIAKAVTSPQARAVGSMALRAPLTLAMGAAGGGGDARKALRAQQAVQKATAEAQAAPGALEKALQGSVEAVKQPKSKIRVPSLDQMNQYIAQGGQHTGLVTQFRDALPDMNPTQVQEALRNFRQIDPNIFKSGGVQGMVTEAAAAVKASRPTVTGLEASAGQLLSKASPRYGYGAKQFGTQFASDVDRLVYTVTKSDGQGGVRIMKDNKTHTKGLDLLRNAGWSDEQIAQRGSEIRNFLKGRAAKGATGTTIKVPSVTSDMETATQSVADAAQQVKQKRATSKAKAAAAQGLDPQELLKELTGPVKPVKESLPEEAANTVENLPYFPQDIQDSIVMSLDGTIKGEKPPVRVPMTTAHKVGEIAGAISGATTGYAGAQYTAKDQNERDNMMRNLAYMAVGGATGTLLGDVAAGRGGIRNLPDRAQQMIMWQWLTSGSAILKVVATDIPSLVIAPALRATERLQETWNVFDAASYAGKYLNSYLQGLGPGIREAAATMTRSGRTGPGLDIELSQALKSPGEAVGSLIPSVIQSAAAMTENMHAAALQAEDNPKLLKQYDYLRHSDPGKVLDWFKGKLSKDKGFLDAMLESPAGDNISAENWADPSVQQVALQQYVDDGLRTFQKDVLGGTARDRAKQWTLTSPIDPLFNIQKNKIGFNTQGTSGLFARVSAVPANVLTADSVWLGGKYTLPVRRLLAGFWRVASNAGDTAINWTPFLGELNQIAYKDIAPTARHAKQILGGLLTLPLMGIVGSNADGAGPSDPKANREWRDAGHIPETTNILGNRVGNKYGGAFASSALHAAGALNDLRWYESYGKQKYGTDLSMEQKAQFALSDYMKGMLTDEGYFNNLNDLFSLFTGASQLATGQGPSANAKNEAAYEVSGLVPNLMAAPATAERSTVPSVTGSIADSTKARVPGLERQVQPELTTFGHPVQNPQEGWKVLLGSYAGRADLTDKNGEFWVSSLGKEDPVGLATANSKAFHATPDGKGGVIPGTGLPMPPDIRQAVRQTTLGILDQNTDKIKALADQSKMTDKQKVTFARNYQTAMHDKAFFDVINKYGRDKYLATLNPDQQSQFKSLELTYQMGQFASQNRYAGPNGKPLNPDKWGQYDALLAKWKGKPKPPQEVTALRGMQANARAAKVAMAIASPDYPDYVRKHVLPTVLGSDQQFADFMGNKGQPLIGKPNQYTPQQQLQFVGTMAWYSAMPASDPRKKALKAKVDLLHQQSNINQLKTDNSVASLLTTMESPQL